MTVKLHKVTVFLVDCGLGDEYDGLAKLQGDMHHNIYGRIHETQTAEFDREWSDGDPLNMTKNLDNRALLESLVSLGVMGKPISDDVSRQIVNEASLISQLEQKAKELKQEADDGKDS